MARIIKIMFVHVQIFDQLGSLVLPGKGSKRTSDILFEPIFYIFLHPITYA